MKKAVLALILIVAIAGCRQNNSKSEINIAEILTDSTVVNVIYFRIKQRCETCNAVADVARKTVEIEYSDNEKVRFYEVENSDKANEPLLEKFEIAWNALIIVKSDNAIDITQRAFLNAVKNPQTLENLIKTEVNKRLTN